LTIAHSHRTHEQLAGGPILQLVCRQIGVEAEGQFASAAKAGEVETVTMLASAASVSRIRSI